MTHPAAAQFRPPARRGAPAPQQSQPPPCRQLRTCGQGRRGQQSSCFLPGPHGSAHLQLGQRNAATAAGRWSPAAVRFEVPQPEQLRCSANQQASHLQRRLPAISGGGYCTGKAHTWQTATHRLSEPATSATTLPLPRIGANSAPLATTKLVVPSSPDERVGHLQRHLAAVRLAQQQLVHVHAQVLRVVAKNGINEV